jgi:hypothetical protein
MLTGVSILTGLGVTELILMRDGHDYAVVREGLGVGEGPLEMSFHFCSNLGSLLYNPLTPELKSLRAMLPDEIFTGDFAS